jgi:hypothetical protein
MATGTIDFSPYTPAAAYEELSAKYPFTPDRAVHHADTLHLKHQLVLRECGILRLQPVQALGRRIFLDVDVFEKGLEMVPSADITPCKSSFEPRASMLPNKWRSILSLTDVPKNVEYKSRC